MIKIINVTAAYQAAPNSYVRILFTPQIPDGYTAIGVVEWNTNTSAVVSNHVKVGEIEGRNILTSSINTTASMTILCIKDFSKEE